MNLWGFSESFIKEAKDRFAAFLDDAMVNNPLKGEYFLPSVVSQLLDESGQMVRRYLPRRQTGNRKSTCRQSCRRIISDTIVAVIVIQIKEKIL